MWVHVCSLFTDTGLCGSHSAHTALRAQSSELSPPCEGGEVDWASVWMKEGDEDTGGLQWIHSAVLLRRNWNSVCWELVMSSYLFSNGHWCQSWLWFLPSSCREDRFSWLLLQVHAALINHNELKCLVNLFLTCTGVLWQRAKGCCSATSSEWICTVFHLVCCPLHVVLMFRRVLRTNKHVHPHPDLSAPHWPISSQRKAGREAATRVSQQAKNRRLISQQ